MGMRIGYARVSSAGQKLDVQLDKLEDCDRVYYDKASASSTTSRPELLKAQEFVRDDDVLVVTKLERLARSVVDMAMIITRLQEKDVDLVVLDQGIDTTTMYGRLQFILTSIGEFEREIIKERSREGREKVITNGVKFGAPQKLSETEIAQLIRDYESPDVSKKDLAEFYGLSRSLVYRIYKERCPNLSD